MTNDGQKGVKGSPKLNLSFAQLSKQRVVSRQNSLPMGATLVQHQYQDLKKIPNT